MEQHVREKHLGISSSNGDHEEDFYYTEIDVFDSNISQDSSGISSADSPCGQSPANCCGGDANEFCTCSHHLKFKNDPKDGFDDELFEEEKLYNSKLMRAKKLKEIRLDRLNKQQSIRGRKTKKNSASLVWTKKGLLKCNGAFEMKRNRVGRPRRLLNCNQQLSANATMTNNTNNLKKSGKQQPPEQTLLRGLEYSVRLSASSPINIPGRIAISHQAYSNGGNQGLLDLSYNSDQFKVGSIRSNGLLEQCMAKEHRKYQNSHNPKHNNSYDFVSSYSTSSSGVQSIDSLGTSVFSINSSLASSSSTTSSSPPSPSLLSNFSTPDQDADWLYSNSEKQNGQDDENYLDEVKFSNANLCNKNSLFTAHNHSIKKSTNSLMKASARTSKDQQENALPFSRSARQTVTLVNPQPNGGYSNSLKSQKSAGYYASLHRGIIQPPNLMQQFTNFDFANSLQPSNHQTTQASATISKASKNVTARRSRNGSGNSGKCRKKFGMENKQQWCLQCRWKKACSRVDPNNLMAENELSSNATLVQH